MTYPDEKPAFLPSCPRLNKQVWKRPGAIASGPAAAPPPAAPAVIPTASPGVKRPAEDVAGHPGDDTPSKKRPIETSASSEPAPAVAAPKPAVGVAPKKHAPRVYSRQIHGPLATPPDAPEPPRPAPKPQPTAKPVPPARAGPSTSTPVFARGGHASTTAPTAPSGAHHGARALPGAGRGAGGRGVASSAPSGRLGGRGGGGGGGAPAPPSEEEKQIRELNRKRFEAEQRRKRMEDEQVRAREDARREEREFAEQRQRQLTGSVRAMLSSAEVEEIERELRKAGRPAIHVDAAFLARIASSRSDYDALGLAPDAASSAAEVRSRYRQLAVALHPDKCSVPGAKEAFARVHAAYQNLLKYTVTQ